MSGQIIHMDKRVNVESPEELDRRNQLKGYKYQYLAGLDHAVVGRDRDGRRITRGEVQEVFNHAYLIDFVKGAGTYLQHTGPRQEDVLKLAIELYGAAANAENAPQLVLVK